MTTLPSTPNRRVFRSLRLDGLWGRAEPLEVDLDPAQPTLIAGANGCGKTTLLRMVRALFQGDWLELMLPKYDRLTVEMDKGKISVTRGVGAVALQERAFPARRAATTASGAPREVPGYRVEVVWEQGEARETYIAACAMGRWASRITIEIGPLARWRGGWYDRSTGRQYTDEELIAEFGTCAGEVRFSDVEEPGQPDMPAWLRDVLQQNQVLLIESQRLGVARPSPDDEEEGVRRRVGRPPGRWPASQQGGLLAVERCALDMRRHVREVVRKFAERAQHLDRTFAQRVLKRATATGEGLREAYEKTTARLAELEGLGLIPKGNVPPEFPQTAPRPDEARIISLYVDDMRTKLEEFDEGGVRERAREFLTTLNGMLQGKEVRMDTGEDGGLVVWSTGDNRRLPTRALSSGEQHLLVMLYDLIWPSEGAPALVMIDEPEISLHVEWQMKLVGALERAAKFGPTQILIATHAPGITWRQKVKMLTPASVGALGALEE